MRQGQNSRRSRGRGNNSHSNGGHNNGGGGGGGRRPSGPQRHQTFDSNGPDVRIRGTAFQIHEKYQALARDAQASGDRVAAENYLQHAEHYYRIICQITEQERARQEQAGGHRQYAHGGQPGLDGAPGELEEAEGSESGEDDREAVSA